ncbi:hypothetical protein LOTGIDRAFT_157203 [Lottia gigantea]|uniref:Uncharacterized protein n=1 Tax=Lottia gigantea TaxID=225164 RepID=V4B8H5_LOTGI|nr:hypothetical protein LOTGIDRAFT_157203 [Lottia gigantea]ESP02062.1 hypothetical protein LOTGIDRAFT_157203 [Lottia gigantea]
MDMAIHRVIAYASRGLTLHCIETICCQLDLFLWMFLIVSQLHQKLGEQEPQPLKFKKKSSESDTEVVLVDGNDVFGSAASPINTASEEEDPGEVFSASSSSSADDDQTSFSRPSRERRSPIRYQDYVMAQTSTTSVERCPPAVLKLLLSDDFMELPLDKRNNITKCPGDISQEKGVCSRVN